MMKIELEIHRYERESGLRIEWMNGSTLIVELSDNEVLISGNRAGLLTLATHLATLAQPEVPAGNHLHYEPDSGLEPASESLILLRLEK